MATVMTTLDLAMIQAIDERVAMGQKTLLAMGTVTAWNPNSPTDIQVTFDSSAIAVPCKVYDVLVAEGDRVGLARFGPWWTVVGTFTRRWRQVLGGTRWTGGGNLVTGLGVTELVIMTSASVFIPPNSQIQYSAGIRLLDTISAGSTYVFRIRDGNSTSGFQHGEFTWTSQSVAFGYNQYFWCGFDSLSTPDVRTFCLTAAKVGGSGLLTMVAGGGNHNTHLIAYAVGPSAVIEERATP